MAGKNKTNVIIVGGFTLIEMLIACAVSVLLLIGLFKVYQSVQHIEKNNALLIGMQTRAQFVSHLLQKRIRMAGFAGCGLGGLAVDQTNAIQGYDADHLPAFLQGEIADHSDVMVIGECLPYHAHKQFMRIAYFIGDTHRKSSSGQPIYALYAKKLPDGHREELAEGISQLKIQYGLADPHFSNILSYQSAHAIENWSQVKSIDLSFLIDSINPVLPTSYFAWFNKNFHSTALVKPWGVYVVLRERG